MECVDVNISLQGQKLPSISDLRKTDAIIVLGLTCNPTPTERKNSFLNLKNREDPKSE